MLKVVCIVDKTGTALDRLAKGVAKYHDNLDYQVLDVHPKRPDPIQLENFERIARDADIIDWQYYRTAEMLRAKYDWLKEKKQILTHNNPYSIHESDWNTYDAVVGNNEYIFDSLTKITNAPTYYIPLTVDTEFWKYNLDWQPNKNVIMVANRIEAKKGILEVAIACSNLNMHFILVGAVSDANYFEAIMATGNVEFHEQISDEELRQLYWKSTIHVCNSVDKFESGTMPILEAMLCGVPVLTRPVGHVPDLYNGDNMVIYDGSNEDISAIEAKLQDMIFDKKALEALRDRGWNTAKTRSFERRAYIYQKLYREVLHRDIVPVSVIMPIYEKPDIIRQAINAIGDQDYKNIELIISDDSGQNRNLVRDLVAYMDIPVRYIDNTLHTEAVSYPDYGLARARNRGIIEATGEILVFCDQRMIMRPNTVSEFVSNMKKRHWLYGNKGGKKEFVENLSAVYRVDLVNAGMFCERMDAYGGLSQETRTRIRAQGIVTEYIESAKANPIGKSSNRNRKREDIIRIKNRLAKMYEL